MLPNRFFFSNGPRVNSIKLPFYRSRAKSSYFRRHNNCTAWKWTSKWALVCWRVALPLSFASRGNEDVKWRKDDIMGMRQWRKNHDRVGLDECQLHEIFRLIFVQQFTKHSNYIFVHLNTIQVHKHTINGPRREKLCLFNAANWQPIHLFGQYRKI